MNVFILNTGRCGSATFIKACNYISNYSSGHETRSRYLGKARLDYPENHIEADNRLSWFLGRLDERYGDDGVYIHLKRNRDDTARSYAKRYPHSIIKAYRQAILMQAKGRTDPLSICLDYCDTVEKNIELFLKDKTKKMEFILENAEQDFVEFWELIGAEGDKEKAIAEFEFRYNASKDRKPSGERVLKTVAGVLRKIRRLALNLPHYIRHG